MYFCTVCECYLGKDDRARYKCVTVKQQPVDQQSQTLVQSSAKGVTNGLGVKEDLLCTNASCFLMDSDPPIQFESITDQLVICSDHNKSFRWSGDLKRHKCLPARSEPTYEQHGSVQCEHCQ